MKVEMVTKENESCKWEISNIQLDYSCIRGRNYYKDYPILCSFAANKSKIETKFIYPFT